MPPTLEILRSHRRRIANLRRELRTRLRQLARAQRSLAAERAASALLRADLRVTDRLLQRYVDGEPAARLTLNQARAIKIVCTATTRKEPPHGR